MSLAKLTAAGDVEVARPWARPDAYETWLSLLPREDFEAVVDAMNTAIDRMDVVRAQYIVCLPGGGQEWYPVYEAVYEAMNSDHEYAGKFVGLILWEVMYNRSEPWYFQKIDKTIVNQHNLVEDIQVMEYFRATDFPQTGRWRSDT